ncbi:ClpP/crotonase-like domain-containing protein [Trichoderma afarasin]
MFHPRQFLSLLFFLSLLARSTASTQPSVIGSPRDYKTFTFQTTGNVTRVLISHPPINLVDADVIYDFRTLLLNLQKNHASEFAPKVVIFSSADPEFFLSHLDLHILSKDHPLKPPLSFTEVQEAYNNITTLLSTVPTIFIGEVSGRAEGAGNELLVQMDMRFASPGALMGASEVAIGLTHGVGGIQYLTRLIGLGRAAEFLLAGKGADGRLAAEWGWVNRAFDSKQDMESYVDNLSARIGMFARQGLEATKRGIRYGFGPRPEALAEDLTTVVDKLVPTKVSQGFYDKWFELSKDETRSPFELDLFASLPELCK